MGVFANIGHALWGSVSSQTFGSVCLSLELICGPPPDPDPNGSVHYSSTEFDAVATYSCNAGYYLMGHQETVCELWEMWTRPAPRCKGELFNTALSAEISNFQIVDNFQ